MTLRVLSLDPGDRVGWARADVAEDGSWENLRHGITPLREMALTLYTRMDSYNLVIYESWRLRADKANEFVGSAFPSVQFIGMLRLLSWLDKVELVEQHPTKKPIADKTMAAWRPELYAKVTKPRKHDDAHDMDAIRHLFYWTWDRYISVPPTEGVVTTA